MTARASHETAVEYGRKRLFVRFPPDKGGMRGVFGGKSYRKPISPLQTSPVRQAAFAQAARSAGAAQCAANSHAPSLCQGRDGTTNTRAHLARVARQGRVRALIVRREAPQEFSDSCFSRHQGRTTPSPAPAGAPSPAERGKASGGAKENFVSWRWREM
jgi:hypothetical protein